MNAKEETDMELVGASEGASMSDVKQEEDVMVDVESEGWMMDVDNVGVKEEKHNDTLKVTKTIKKKRRKKSRAPKEQLTPEQLAERRKERQESFKFHIYGMVKDLLPDMGISGPSMNILESFAWNLFNLISEEASKIARRKKKKSIQSIEMEVATRHILSRERADRAVVKAKEAVAKSSV